MKVTLQQNQLIDAYQEALRDAQFNLKIAREHADELKQHNSALTIALVQAEIATKLIWKFNPMTGERLKW